MLRLAQPANHRIVIAFPVETANLVGLGNRRQSAQVGELADFDERRIGTEPEIVAGAVNEPWIDRQIRIGLQFGSRLGRGSGTEIVRFGILHRIKRQYDPT